MAGMNFPPTPSVGTLFPTVFVPGQPQYRWDGEKWTSSLVAGSKKPIYDDGSVPMAAQLTLLATPVNPQDAAAKGYVDAGDAAISTGIASTIDAQITAKAVRYDGAQTLTAANRKQVATNTGLNKGLFLVDRNGTNQTGLTVPGYNQIQFNNKQVDIANWFNAATYRYQPTEPGWYFFYLAAATQNSAVNETTQPAIRKNGAIVTLGNYLSSAGNLNVLFANGCGLISLNGTTDYVDAATWCPTSTTAIYGAADRTYLMGWKVSDL